MAKIVFTKELVENTGALGDVMASFLGEQITSIQNRLVEKYPHAEKNAAWRIIATFATFDGTKIPMNKSTIHNKIDLPSPQVEFVLNLYEKARILRLADNTFEIAHDTLAFQVAEKRSSEEKALLEIQKFISNQYTAYTRTHTLLNQKGLNYITPYLTKVKLSEEEDLFIKKSQRKARRRKLLLLGLVALAFAVTLLFAADAHRLRLLAEGRLKIAKAKIESLEELAGQFRNNKKYIEEKLAIAERNAQLAKLNNEIAERELAAAVRARNEAIQLVNDNNTPINNEQLKIAEAALQKAKKQVEETNQKLTKAKQEKSIAIAEKERANQDKQVAIQDATTAKINSLRSLADDLATKSLELNQQKQLKGLLALEAYNLNNTVGDNNVSTKINQSLYNAIEQLSKKNFDAVQDVHKGAIRSVIKAGNDVIYSTGSDGQLLKSQMSDWQKVGSPKKNTKTILAERISNIDVAISPNGDFISFANKKPSIQIIDAKSNQVIATISNPKQGFVQNIAFSSDNQKLLSIGRDKAVWEYDLKKNLSKKILTLNQNAKTMTVHPNNNQMVLGYPSGLIEVYNLADLSQPNSIIQLDQKITILGFEPTSNMLVAGDSKGQIHFFNSVNNQYDLNNYEMKMVHNQQISKIAFSNNEIAIGSFDGSVSIWSLEHLTNKDYEPILLEDNQWVMSLIYSEYNNQWIIGYADGSLRFWTSNSKTLANHLCQLIQQNPKKNKLTDAEFKKYFGEAVERKNYSEYCK